MYWFNNQLRAIAEAGAARLKDFQPVILGGFTKGVPPNVKLSDIKPTMPDELNPAQREAKFQRNRDFLAGKLEANQEQIEATKRSYNAPAGLSLVHGGPKTGKTITALLQALTAVSMGHKVILCAPTASCDDLKDLVKRNLTEMPDGGTPKVYVADNPSIQEFQFRVYELLESSNDLDSSMPVCHAKSPRVR